NYTFQSGLSCFVASILYSVQIYGDFGGYSLMAIGAGKILGFNLTNNFNRPYFSTSVTDFWRRWHISLSTWLKDYIYIPLGGSRCSKPRNYFNIFITFLVSGIWHGANWTFIIWGILHGFFQIIEKMFGLQKANYKGVIRGVRILITFLIVNLLWIFFRMPNLSDAIHFIGKMVTDFGNWNLFLPNRSDPLFILLGLSILFIKEVSDEFFPAKIHFFNNRKLYIRWSAYAILLVIILLTGVFDASQFIYVNF
ncbi:MAG: MBOAT family O-acyltransferase, partial [Bacteroidota bacterium]|nr:MBOAT family O-acyltransferase [Bacteroidota bacterium]